MEVNRGIKIDDANNFDIKTWNNDETLNFMRKFYGNELSVLSGKRAVFDVENYDNLMLLKLNNSELLLVEFIVWKECRRNHGLGYQYLQMLKPNLLVKSGQVVNLWVYKDNLPAIHLYEKFGFQMVNDFIFQGKDSKNEDYMLQMYRKTF